VYHVPVKVDQGLLDLCVTVAARPDHVPGRGALLQLCEKLFYMRTKVRSVGKRNNIWLSFWSTKKNLQIRDYYKFHASLFLASTAVNLLNQHRCAGSSP